MRNTNTFNNKDINTIKNNINKKIIVIYHVYQSNNWEQLFAEQMGLLYMSGLYFAADELIIGVNGEHKKRIPVDRQVIYYHNGFSEKPSLLLAREKAIKNPDSVILYMHMKGISHPNTGQDDWRMLMQHFLIWNWKEAIKYLNDNDVVTVNLRDSPRIHGSGNFWWANADYLSKLDVNYLVEDKKDINERMSQEFWIGSIPDAKIFGMHNTKIDHYSVPYKSEKYTENYYNNNNYNISVNYILTKFNIDGHDKDWGTDKETYHSYGKTYERILDKYLDRHIVLVEVGVQYGGSLLLWHELLPKSKILGIDIENIVHDYVLSQLDKERYTLLIENGYTDSIIEKINLIYPEGLDVVIDDGSHSLEDQESFLKLYLPLLNSGGVAIIEDIQSYEHFEQLISLVDTNEFTFEIVDLRDKKDRYDDLMFIVYRN